MKKRILILTMIFIAITNIKIRESHSAPLIYPYIKYDDINNHWAEEAILDTSALGYMQGTSKTQFKPNAEITYVEMLLILIRTMGLEEYAQVLEADNWIESTYQVAEEVGLIEDIRPGPREKVSREQAAYLLGKSLDKKPPLGNDIKLVKRFDDYSKIRVEKTPYIELVLQEGYMHGNTSNLFNPRAYISRGEIAQIISNGKSKLVTRIGIVEKQGQILKKELGKLTIYNVDSSSDIIDYSEKGNTSFPVYKDKRLYLPEILEEKNNLTYYIGGNNEIIYAKIKDGIQKKIEGTVETIDFVNREIIVLDFRDKKHKLKLHEYLDMDKLYFGQEVILSLEGEYITELSTVEEEDPERDGYIIPGTRFRVGKVLFASKDEIEIQSEKGREKFQIDPFSTNLYKKGKLVELFQLKEGDRVLLNFDDIYSTTVSEIKIEDEERHIKGIIKGEIELVDQRNKEVLIKEPQEYNLGTWKQLGDKIKIKLGTGEIYQGSRRIDISSLDKMKGQETYIAYERNYGSPSIAKMTLKSGPAMEYKDKLQDIDYGSEKLILNTNSFDFHAGTIVVKDNRLVDTLNLEKDQSLFIASDYKNGVKGVSFISIEGTSPVDDRVDESRLMAFKGKIEDVLDYKLIIGEKEFDHSQEFVFTEDTLVYDSQLEKEIPIKAFKDSSYIDLIDVKDRDLRDRLEKGFYKNKMAYIVSREREDSREVLGINLVPSETNIYEENLKLKYNIKGTIKNIDQSTKTLQLNGVQNYNNLTNTWENAIDQEIDLSKTIVILNDKAISLDKLYKIRKNTNAYLVREKKTSKATTYILIIED